LSKTTIILGGAYGGIIILLVFVFFGHPQTDPSHYSIIPNSDNNLLATSSSSPSLSLADLFAKSEDGVVLVKVIKVGDSPNNRDIGSGIVYDYDGHIVTNNHVVENADKISVIFHDGNSLKATVVGADPFADLAVIKVNATASVFHPLTLGDSSNLRIGDAVAAIGSPFGLTGSMTSGIVSQVGRLLVTPDTENFSIPNVIQTDAAINPGNSGGPLLNMQGQVIGINTAIQSSTGEFSGIGFAIPSNSIKRIVPALIKDGTYTHPWLGISGTSIDSDLADTLGLPVSSGFMIQEVVKQSPAEKAGLRGYNSTKTVDGTNYKIGGDIIVGIDGIQISKIEDILNYLEDQKQVGDKITMQIIRDDQTINVYLILEKRPDHKNQ